MVRLGLALLALSAAGCAGRHRPAPTPTVVVTRLQLDFPERDRGELAFSLTLPPGSPQATEVAWELFLDGARFATGLERVLAQEPGAIAVTSSLVVRHLDWREGEASLDVVLQGDVDFGDGRERQRFRDRRDVVVHGRPQLNIPRD